MRKAAFFLGGGLCLFLIAGAVSGKEEPGSRQTFGQRVNSLFGIIDRGENAPPPPPPPDMPSYGRQRTPHMTVPSNNSSSRNSSSGSAYTPNPGAAASRLTGTPTPPMPRRDGGVAAADDFPPEETMPNLNATTSKPGLLEQSRKPLGGALFNNRAAARTGAPNYNEAGAPAPSANAGAPAGGYRSNVTTNGVAAKPNYSTAAKAPAALQALPNAAPAVAVPRAAGGVPQLPPAIMSSRRRQPAGTDGAAAEPTLSPSESPNLTPVTPPATSTTAKAATPTADRTEPFVPATPFTADSRSARPYGTSTNTAGSTAVAADTPQPVPVTSQPVTQPEVSARRTTAPAAVEPAPLSQFSTATVPTPIPSNGASGSAQDSSPTRTAQTASASHRSAVLTTFNSPEITVETVGPQRIAIGREATYRILVRNRGTAEAHQVVATIVIPQWAEVVELHGTAGNTTNAEEHASGTPLEWRIDLLAGRAEEELTVVLVPRRSEAFDLQVRWACSPAVAAAAIEVEEPQLQLSISGPSEVSFGEQRLYKLTVVNPGTGTAENVQLHLMPLSPGDDEPVTHKIGDLAAGRDISVEVELTARQAGRLQIRTEATAAGDLKSSASTEVVVHRAALDIAVTAPKLLFAGVPGNYEVRVRNTGDEPARNVRLSVDLPGGAKLITASPAPRGEAASGEVAWAIDRLPAGAEQVYVLKCALGQGGRQQLTASAAADGDLRKSVQASTDVQAVADVALDVVDTPGPVAVGQPITYEIRVKNRGMKGAEGVDVVAFFSEGIEPEKAEGSAVDLQPGMAVFKTMTTLGAGQEKILKITARATTAGNHRLRVELHCAAPQMDLSQEDSTFFYVDESLSSNSSPGDSGNNRVTTHGGAISAPATFKPDVSSPIGPTGPTAQPISTLGDRYGSATMPAGGAFTPIALPAGGGAAVQTSVQGAANTPATVYPAALPPRKLSNELR